MTFTSIKHGSLTTHIVHAEVPYLKQPKITGEKFIDGVRYYIGEGKEYLAELFDKMFKCEKSKIKPFGFKGEQIGLDAMYS